MSARDELAELLCRNELYYDTGSHLELSVDDAADAILAAGYSKPRTITTAEELDALPSGAVVRSDMGVLWEKDEYTEDPARPWWTSPGDSHQYPALRISLPATVLYTPKES